ncbi:SDR family NAD(P)-dependent oxidoreductase [Treponema primitia]|uniref:SDR family NAD(P)-dependent oxidoreductase n=1 Tax=Treponema primitia TaxID=88058 RepID=UPI0018E11185|nr:SDR family oxidoreductase [Treponema primitia]
MITGASSGIGYQCALDCARSGAKVILIARRKELLDDLAQNCSTASVYPYDLNDIDNIKSLMDEIKQHEGLLDGFIHAAGIEKTLPLKNLKLKNYETIYRLNFVSGLEIVKHFSNKKYHNEYAKIVFISSIVSIIGRPGIIAYAGSKGALVSAAKSIALELATKNINVNCISPGTVLTPMIQKYFDSISGEEQEKRKEGYPLGLGKPEDISYASIFLLSDAARWITGQNIIIDGGYTIR